MPGQSRADQPFQPAFGGVAGAHVHTTMRIGWDRSRRPAPVIKPQWCIGPPLGLRRLRLPTGSHSAFSIGMVRQLSVVSLSGQRSETSLP